MALKFLADGIFDVLVDVNTILTENIVNGDADKST